MNTGYFGLIAYFMLQCSFIITQASITVPYIKPMLLGRTFDYSKSTVGNDIFPQSINKNLITKSHYHSDVSYRVIRNTKDIRDVLDISGHLSVQIMAGFILDVSGSGRYLKESSESGNFVEVMAKIAYQTVTKTLTDDVKPNTGWDQRPIIGKHYVRSITYGGHLFASLKFHAKNQKDRKNVEAKVNTNLRVGVKFSLGIGGQFKKLSEAVKDISTLTISYTATVPLETIPTDIDSLVTAIKGFSKSVKKVNSGQGVPIEAEIVELSQLTSKPELAFLINNVIKTRLDSLESMYHDLLTTTNAVKKLLERHPTLNSGKETAIGVFYSKLFEITEIFNTAIAAIDLNLRSTSKTDQFQKAFDAYKDKGVFLPDKYMREFRVLAVKIEGLPSGNGVQNFIGFHASLEKTASVSSGVLKFDKIDFEYGGGFDNISGVFTAPVMGIYQFTLSVLPWPTRKSSRNSALLTIVKGGKTYSKIQSNRSAKSTQISKTALIKVNKGESVHVALILGSIRGIGSYSTFGGYLVRTL